MDRDMHDSDMRRSQGRAVRDNRQEGRSNGNTQGYALDELVEIIKIILCEESRAVPMKKNMRIVDVDKAMDFLESMRQQMPSAIPEARRIKEERDQIIQEAERRAAGIYNDADNRARVAMEDAEKMAQATVADAEARAAQIIDEAQKHARVLIDQSEVRRIAEDEANKLISTARSKASDTMRKATQYADTMLANLADFLNSELGDVQKSRENITPKR